MLLTQKESVTLYSAEQPLTLESGRTLGPVTVAYELLGQLSAARDNCVVICHALTGDSHVAGRYAADDAKPGWWDAAVGPGKAIDTDRYCVLCANVIGGCGGSTGPSAIDPATGRPYGADFPLVTPRDMVRVELRLLAHLGIPFALAAIGGSLGAMQALEWGVIGGECILGVIPIAGASRFHPQGIAWNLVQRRAITNDPAWQNGQYYPGPGPTAGLATARMLGMITYRSDESMWSQFGRDIRSLHLVDRRRADWDDGYGGRPAAGDAGATEARGGDADDLARGFDVCYEVESYLHYNGDALVRRFDANSYLYLSKAMDLHDISRGFPSLAAAHASVQAEALVIGIRSDLLFPPYLQKETATGIQAAGGVAEYLEMNSPWGHDAFLVDFHLIADPVARFLARMHQRARALSSRR